MLTIAMSCNSICFYLTTFASEKNQCIKTTYTATTTTMKRERGREREKKYMLKPPICSMWLTYKFCGKRICCTRLNRSPWKRIVTDCMRVYLHKMIEMFVNTSNQL